MRGQSTRSDSYQVITDRIIAALEGGVVPWRKPWASPEGALQNAASGHTYRGINTIILGLTAATYGYSDPRWVTFKQAQDLGGHVRKGEKASPVVFWKFHERDEEGEEAARRIPLLRRYSVFNVAQCDGLDLEPLPEAETREIAPIEAAERILAGYQGGPTIAHDGGGRAYYVPARDAVHLPARETFESAEAYYAVAFHEAAHSTGHEQRLNRHGMETGIAPFGSPTYSREELAAEFGSAFLLAEAGIADARLDQSAAYVGAWLRVLKGDKRIAIVAAGQGQKAADHILGR